MVWNSVVDEVLGDGNLVNGDETQKHQVDDSVSPLDVPVGGMFVAIGHTPNTTFPARRR